MMKIQKVERVYWSMSEKSIMRQNSPSAIYESPVQTGSQTKYGNNRWEVYSPKLRRNITLYSNLEYDHWVLVETDPDIQTFCEQPLKIRIKLPIGDVTTIFDMWIKWKSGIEEFCEIKFDRELRHLDSASRIGRQIAAQKKWCELGGFNYSVVTERIIRANPTYLLNCKLILRFLNSTHRLEFSSSAEKVRSILAKLKSCSLGELENCFPDSEPLVIRGVIFNMIIAGEIKADIDDKSLDRNTRLEMTDGSK